MSKQKSEEELKDKNQLLEAVNKQLHQKLTETQVRDPPDLCHQLSLGYACKILMGGSKLLKGRRRRSQAHAVLSMSSGKDLPEDSS